jgi:large subunit ribosomal protein L32e
MIKKQHPKFNVPNAGAKNRKSVPERWRKQRGVDNKKRVKKDFAGAEPTIGYRNPEELRGVRASGKRAVLVHDMNELKDAIENPDLGEFEVMLAGSLSKRKKMLMTAFANQNKINVTNGVMK